MKTDAPRFDQSQPHCWLHEMHDRLCQDCRAKAGRQIAEWSDVNRAEESDHK